jgi:hypothetical protein
MHKIYCFANGSFGGGGDVCGVAIGDDGEVVAGHISSCEGWMRHDLGITSNWKHELYDAHFGVGNWELEHVKPECVATHAGLQAALALNRQEASP